MVKSRIIKYAIGCSSVVECALIMQWIVGSIPHGGPIELILIPASAGGTRKEGRKCFI